MLTMRYLRNTAIPFLERLIALITQHSDSDLRKLFARDIADIFGVSRGVVYNAITHARRDGIGIHTTPEGYVMSNMASEREDLQYIARQNYLLRSIRIGMNSAAPSIKGRWSSRTGEGRYVRHMVNSFMGSIMESDNNVNILNSMLRDDFDI